MSKTLLDVSLPLADMLITGIDAFIIKISEVNERMSSLRNCLSRVKGSEREPSVVENIRKLELCSKMTDFIPETVRFRIGNLKDMIDHQNLGLQLTRTSAGRHFQEVLNEVWYICQHKVIYTTLVKTKFHTFYTSLQTMAGSIGTDYEFVYEANQLLGDLYEFLKDLEQYEVKLKTRLYNYDMSVLDTSLDIELGPDISNLSVRVNDIAAAVDDCVHRYYKGDLSQEEVQTKLRAFVSQLSKLQSLIPLGSSESKRMLDIVETRLRICTISFKSIQTVEEARHLINSAYEGFEVNKVEAVAFGLEDVECEGREEDAIEQEEQETIGQSIQADWCSPIIVFQPK